MKFRLTFKTPDAVEDGIQRQLAEDGVYSEEAEEAHSEMKSLAERFVEYGEYITVEFDTEQSSARVLKINER